jgi:hypothetical protein
VAAKYKQQILPEATQMLVVERIGERVVQAVKVADKSVATRST